MDVETVRYHLLHSGFVENYFVWKHQGEKELIREISSGNDLNGGPQSESGYDNPYRHMVLDTVGPNFNHGSMEEDPNPSMEEEPNLESQKFYDLLQAADAKLYLVSSLSQLAVVSRMLNIKMKNNMSQRGYNQMTQLLKEALPEDNMVLDSYYQTKKLVRKLGLPDVCCIGDHPIGP
ncbi:hypothetical protein KY290_001363 [Solanum tuberosum]|uniref:Transposase-associated domain-containing protein n=1 Tax=Solanum tuberosum TaxID=4113 RepID=A0ABQ7WM37_SOLTU|nr:hypothetical protein KY290_001363 [Solanum tuberosum]